MSLYRGAGGASDATDDSTVNAVAGYASAAASSASAAATSATNASNSATAAASSASGAASSASSVATNAANASSSAGLANTYATAASNSKDAAAASAVTASTKAGEASTSASNAATSASTATTQATNASNSASAAAASASDAADSAADALAIYGNTAAVNAAVAAAAASAASSAAYADASNEILSYVNFSRDEATAAADDASAWASASQASANDAQGYATAALSARDATLAAYDSFDDRYLGVKPLDPTTDNDGNPLIAGTLYFNQVSEMMKLYTGTAWVAAYTSGGSPAFDDVTIVGSTTLSGLTANRIPYLNASKVLTTDASSLTYDGSGNMSVSGFVTAGSLSLSNGTANGVAYLNGSKVLTTGAALTFDGTTLGSPALNITGNTTLGDASTDTVAVNGYMGVGIAPNSTIALYARGTALTGTTQTGVYSYPTATSAATVALRSFSAQPGTADAVFTVANVAGFYAFNPAKGAASTITNAHGLYIADQTTGTNNYGITSLVSSGTDKWNIYASGTANNYFAGNLGLGVTPSAWGSGFKVIESGAASKQAGLVFYTGADRARLISNQYWNGTNWVYKNTSGAGAYELQGDSHVWYTAASGTAGNAITFTQAMTLNASGNLGIGTTSPDVLGFGGSWKVLSVLGTGGALQLASISTSAGANLGSLAFGSSNVTAADKVSASIRAVKDNATVSDAAASLQFFTSNGTANTERARIDSSGNLLVGMTAPATSSAKTIHLANATVPTANPTGGGVLYVEGGALKYRGSSGTVTTIAAA